MTKRHKLGIMTAAGLALVGVLLFMAWQESRRPLAGLRADDVKRASVFGVTRGSRGRALMFAELDELCAALEGARITEPPDGEAAVRVELDTTRFGLVEVRDFGGPGARLVIDAGGARSRDVVVRSGRLGRCLAALAASLAPPPVETGTAPGGAGG